MSDQKPNTACIYRRFGGPEVLEIIDDAEYPALAADGVILRVVAVSLNPKDTLLRRGKFNGFLARDPLPRGTALDAAGEIVAVGERVSDLQVGDTVLGMTNRFCGGLMANYVAMPAGEVAVAPETLTMEQSAAVPLAALTALQALRDQSELAPGKRILIVGASGGVGHFAVQIAKLLGAEVHACCSADNLDFVRQLGADRAIDYRRQAPTSIEYEYDAVFDVVGRYHRRAFARQLGRRGIYVSTIPGPGSVVDELLARIGLRKTARLVIVKSNRADLEWLAEHLADGRLQVHVSASYALEEVRDAHLAMQSGHTRGKLVVRLADGR